MRTTAIFLILNAALFAQATNNVTLLLDQEHVTPTAVTSWTGSGAFEKAAAAVPAGTIVLIEVNAPGNGYVVGDIVTIVEGAASGGSARVTSVSLGRATGIQVVYGHRGTGYSVAQNLTTTGGSGSALTVNVTEVRAARGTINLPPGHTDTISSSLTFPSTMHVAFGSRSILRPAAGTVVTLPPNITADQSQHFDISAGGTVNFSVAPSPAYVTWWGADPTGMSDSGAAIQAAYAAAPQSLIIPCGVYSSSAALTFGTQSTSLHGESEGCTRLNYTGTKAIADFMTLGNDVTGAINFSFGDMEINGNAHVANTVKTHALLQGSVVTNLKLGNATSSCLKIDSNVSVLYSSIHCSANHDTTPPINGIYVTGGTTSTLFVAAVTEYHKGYGRYIDSAETIKFISSTSESNGVNTWFGASAFNDELDSTDDEQACIENVHDAGYMNKVLNSLIAVPSHYAGCSATPPSIRVASTANSGVYTGNRADQFVVDAGALNAKFESNLTGNNCCGSACVATSGVMCSVIDNGTNTALIGNRSCCGAGAIPTILPYASAALGASGGTLSINSAVTTPYGLNIAYETASSADNALVAAVNDAFGNPVTVRQGGSIRIRLGHSLVAGGPNTLNLNGTGARPIVRQYDGGPLSRNWIGSGLWVDLINYGDTAWLVVGAQ